MQGDDDGEGGPASVRAEYTGIGVEVKFAAGTKVHKMRELSGGQQVRPPAWDLLQPTL